LLLYNIIFLSISYNKKNGKAEDENKYIKVVINYRPVLIAECLEASYPSSTTLVVLCIMPTSLMQLKCRIKNKIIKKCVTFSIYGFISFMIIGRFLSGVHWFTDIIGGIILSVALVKMYSAAISTFAEKTN